MNRIAKFSSLAGAALLAGVLLVSGSPRDRADDTWFRTERAHLQNRLLHATSGSAQAFKMQMKIDRLDAYREGRPQAGFPDEFAKILYEMKIPSDRTTPGYTPGYQTRELAKTPRRIATDKALTWNVRGPGNVAGRARGIIVDPDDPTGLTWFIASVGGGVWKSEDGGTNWRELTDEVPNLAVQSLAMAASDHDIIYAGTGESFFNIDTMNGNGILKSTDRGETWTQLASTLNDPRFNNVSRIIVSPTDPDLLLAAATTGSYKQAVSATSSIFRSTDGGLSWIEVRQEAANRILQLMAKPTDFNVQYAAVRNFGVLKSTDAGLTWSGSSSGITDLTGRFEIAISPVDPNYLFLSAEGAAHSELWVSWNGGATWNETFENGGSEPNWLGAQGWYDNTIVCHPTNPAIVYVGGPELWKIQLDSVGSQYRTSTHMASYSFPHPDHHGLEIIHPAVGDWFILGTNDGGITRTAGLESGFTMPITGMITTQFYGIDKRPGASAYIGGMQDNGTWRSPLNPTIADPWSFEIGGDGYETSWHFDDPLKIMGGYQYNGLQRSLDGGATWSSATSGLTDTGSANAPFVSKIGKSTARPDVVFAVGKSGVWRSTNFGGSWTLSTTPAAAWGALTSFQDVRVSEANPDVVWAGSRMDADGSLVVSTNGGATFSATSDYTDVVMGRISGLATHPTQPNTAFALFGYAERPKILKTTDLGATWTDLSGFGTGSVSTNGFPDVAIYDLLVWPNDPDKIWVGSEIGLVESLDGGATWALADNGLPAVGIWMVKAVEDEVVVATHGRGIWTITDPALITGLTFKPLLENLYQSPSGPLIIEMNLRSEYDSTEVWVDGSLFQTLGPNTVRQLETVQLPVLATGTRSAFARGFKGGTTYDSVARTVNVFAQHAALRVHQHAGLRRRFRHDPVLHRPAGRFQQPGPAHHPLLHEQQLTDGHDDRADQGLGSDHRQLRRDRHRRTGRPRRRVRRQRLLGLRDGRGLPRRDPLATVGRRLGRPRRPGLAERLQRQPVGQFQHVPQPVAQREQCLQPGRRDPAALPAVRRRLRDRLGLGHRQPRHHLRGRLRGRRHAAPGHHGAELPQPLQPDDHHRLQPAGQEPGQAAGLRYPWPPGAHPARRGPSRGRAPRGLGRTGRPPADFRRRRVFLPPDRGVDGAPGQDDLDQVAAAGRPPRTARQRPAPFRGPALISAVRA